MSTQEAAIVIETNHLLYDIEDMSTEALALLVIEKQQETDAAQRLLSAASAALLGRSCEVSASAQPEQANIVDETIPTTPQVRKTQNNSPKKRVVKTPSRKTSTRLAPGPSSATDTPSIDLIITSIQEPNNEFTEVMGDIKRSIRKNTNGRYSNPEHDEFGSYLESIHRYPVLTAEQERVLAVTIEKGKMSRDLLTIDAIVQLFRGAGFNEVNPTISLAARQSFKDAQQAKQTFLECNLKLVISTARKFRRSGIPMVELCQEGNLGVEHAIDKFDYRRGFKFSTYATWWIKQTISRYVDQTESSVRLPAKFHSDLRNINKTRISLTEELHRNPTTNEIAGRLQLEPEQIESIIVRARSADTISLDAPIGEDGDSNLGNLVVAQVTDDMPFLTNLANQSTVKLALSVLSEREVEIISYRYLGESPETQADVAKQLGLSTAYVRILEKAAIEKMRRKMLQFKSEASYAS
jgi:RNA polymerase sigma factor (sigma-70 family)